MSKPFTIRAVLGGDDDDDSMSESAVLCRFPHGPPMQLTSPDTLRDLTFAIHQHRDDRKSVQRILHCDADRLEYAGKNFFDESFKLNAATFAIALPNVRSRSVELVRVNHIYAMQQRLKHAFLHCSDALTETAAGAIDSYAARQKLLIDSFGSKKRKSQLASRESNKVVMNKEIGDVLESAIFHDAAMRDSDSGTVDEVELAASTKAPLLPPYNTDTDNVAEIFQLHDIIPSAVLNSLAYQSKAILKLANKYEELVSHLSTTLALSTFVRNQILKKVELYIALPPSTSAERKMIETVSILLFVHYLITIKNSRARQVRTTLKSAVMKCSEAVMEHLLSTFTSQTMNDNSKPVNVLNTENSRKVLSYLCLLALLTNNYRLLAGELTLLSEDLKMTVSDLVSWMREIGCTKSTKSQVELTAPLTLGRFRRKRKPVK